MSAESTRKLLTGRSTWENKRADGDDEDSNSDTGSTLDLRNKRSYTLEDPTLETESGDTLDGGHDAVSTRVVQGNTCTKRGATSIRDDDPANKRSTSVGDDASVNRRSTSVGDDASVNRRSTSVGDDDPANKRSTSVRDDASVNRRSTSVGDDASVNRRSTRIAEDDPANKGSTSVGDEDSANRASADAKSSANKGSTSVGDDAFENRRSTSIESETTGDMDVLTQNIDQPISDELLALVGTFIRYDCLGSVACGALGLSMQQYDNLNAPSKTIRQAVCDCLKIGMDRMGISSCKQLKQVLRRAAKQNVITAAYCTEIDQFISFEEEETNIINAVSKCILPEQMEVFFVGYMQLTKAEVQHQMPLPVDAAALCSRVLGLWRTLHHHKGTNSAHHLITALASYPDIDSETVDTITATAIEYYKRGDFRPNFTLMFADSNSTLSRLCTHMKGIYRERYCTICPLPWIEGADRYNLDSVFVTLYVHQQSTVIQPGCSRASTEENISMNQLFSFSGMRRSRGEEAVKILLRGEPGSGKTTLTAKLAWDWSRGETEIEHLLDIPLLFVIKAIRIRGDESLFNYIRREYLADRVDWIRLEDVLVGPDLLIIIDGYDELHGTSKGIQDVLENKELQGATILLTSRLGMTGKIDGFFRSSFLLRGFNDASIRQFIRKYADENTIAKFFEMHTKNHPFINIVTTPLYLWFFVLLGQEYFADIESFTRTDFFKHVTKGIVTKAVHRRSSEKYQKHDVKLALKELCKLAYQCMVSDTSEISKSTYVTRIMEDLGFLNKHVSRIKLTEKTLYTFTHKTIWEFLTAMHVVKYSDENLCVLLSKIPEIADVERRKASVVLPFVFGLVDQKTDGLDEGRLRRYFRRCFPRSGKRVFPTEELLEKFAPKVIHNQAGLVDHTAHFGLMCLSECKNPRTMSCTVLYQHVGRSLYAGEPDGQDCTPYCLRGLVALSKALENCDKSRPGHAKTIDNIYARKSYVDIGRAINTKSLILNQCSSTITSSWTTAACTMYLVSLHLWDVILSAQDWADMLKAICRIPTNMEVIDIKHVRITGESVLSPQYMKVSCRQYLKRLQICNETSSIISCNLMQKFWTKVDEIKLANIELSDEDIARLVETIPRITDDSPTTLKLKWLRNETTCRLLHQLRHTSCPGALRELELRCMLTIECQSVGEFAVLCQSLKVFRWWTRDGQMNANSYDTVTLEHLRQMWQQIATRLRDLHVVMVQEPNVFVSENQDGNVFFNVIRRLSPHQRRVINWQELHLITKEIGQEISDRMCREYHQLLPSLRHVYTGKWWEIDRRRRFVDRGNIMQLTDSCLIS